MQPRPARRVKRHSEPIAGVGGSDEILLISQHGLQPQLAEQRVARTEAVIERALWRLQPPRDGIDRDGARAPLASQRASRGQKARIIEKCSSHFDLDYMV